MCVYIYIYMYLYTYIMTQVLLHAAVGPARDHGQRRLGGGARGEIYVVVESWEGG